MWGLFHKPLFLDPYEKQPGWVWKIGVQKSHGFAPKNDSSPGSPLKINGATIKKPNRIRLPLNPGWLIEIQKIMVYKIIPTSPGSFSSPTYSLNNQGLLIRSPYKKEPARFEVRAFTNGLSELIPTPRRSTNVCHPEKGPCYLKGKESSSNHHFLRG